MSNPVFEIVTYTVKDPAEAQKVRSGLKSVLSAFPGFVSWRQFASATSDRRFVDQVEWDSLASAQSAQEKFMADPSAQELMAQTEEVHAMTHVVEQA